MRRSRCGVRRFAVVAEDGALSAVIVREGVVPARVRGADEILLGAGERWDKEERARPGRPVQRGSAASFGEGIAALERNDFTAARAAFERAAEQSAELEEDALFWFAIALARSNEGPRGTKRTP
jgi:hypothetical protein